MAGRKICVLGISGSPRRGGNSETLLDEALRGAHDAGAETEKLALDELDFGPCGECGGCDKTGRCVIDDDMDVVYKKIGACDALVVATPIFFVSVSARLKMMIDRFHCHWIERFILRRKRPRRKRMGAFICVSAARERRSFINARQIIKAFFATLDIEYRREMFWPGAHFPGSVGRHKGALQRAHRLGALLVKEFR